VIVLDTCVLSEPLAPNPDPRVLAWLAAQPEATLHCTSVTQAEMLLGVRLLPAGRRRDRLGAALRELFDSRFGGRVLAFDGAAAEAHADVVARRRAAGRPVTSFDAQIAAIARARGARVATRNTRDFEGCGLAGIVNPWG
jgi:predicted nucleic acid-binding protein